MKLLLRQTSVLVLTIIALLGTIGSARAQTYTLARTAVLEGPAAGSDSVQLTVNPSTSSWTATANAPWLHTSQSGPGDATVQTGRRRWPARGGAHRRARAPSSARIRLASRGRLAKLSGMLPPDANAPRSAPAEEPWLEVSASRHFTAWLAEERVSLACTTYQTGKLLLLGRRSGFEGPAVFERNFTRCMGLWAGEQTLWLSTQYQLWRLENILRPGELYREHDRLYVPKAGHTTGDLDVHDVVVEAGGRVVFVATGFGCLGTFNERYSFTPLWRPPFLSKLAAEDRCHLNGLALENGRCRYVTATSTSDVADGWRDRRRDGGVILEVPSGEIVCRGLSMPHSPRVYRGELWVHNSGTGYFGRVDRATGQFEPVTFCPGYLRGLAFAGDYAIVGLSEPRDRKTFGDLALDEELERRGSSARCGLQVIDLRTGDVAHWVRFEGMVSELYDVCVLPGVTRPMAFGFRTEEISRTVAMGDPQML